MDAFGEFDADSSPLIQNGSEEQQRAFRFA
jgi:hypothetical protein